MKILVKKTMQEKHELFEISPSLSLASTVVTIDDIKASSLTLA